MVAGLMSIVIMGCVDVGGIDKVWEIANDNNRIQFFEFNPDPTVRHSTWNLIFGSFVTWLYVFGVNQAVCQRFNSVPTLKAARVSILLNIPGTLLLLGLTCLAGLVIFAYYANKGCDPIGAGYITNPNQLLPYFVMDVLGVPGLPGLFVACLFSGSLSTLSSSLSAISANTWEDVLKLKFDHWPEYKKTIVTKCTVVIFGVLSIGMAYMAAGLGGTVVQASMSFSGSAGGALLGIFILGAVFPWSNWIGAVSGGIIGVMFSMWISIGAYVSGRGRPGMLPTTVQHCPYNTTFNATYGQLNLTIPSRPLPPPAEGLNNLYTLSYLWFPSVGFLTTIIVGMIASAITGFNNPADMDPRYHMPIFDWMCGCLIPGKIKRFLNCNVNRSVLQYDDEQILDQKQQARLNESPDKAKEVASPLYETNRTTQVTSDVDINGHKIVQNTKL
ncbi:unnamed protein product [Owenia fusiformis]|uniref:Sodium-coupled monocarboxylate transporter 2 n=1 Tax=Owenia fusiformis TaxID=6347 RepID=A0A8S4PW28_OWEFU|nr:unnamed protein product [Owenia fusiformis]